MSTVDEERARPALSREVIAEAALRLTLEQQRVSLTLARLGAELGADPTAIYRHFRNRDELLLHLVDRSFAEVNEGLALDLPWQELLTSLAWRIREAQLRRPALTADAGWRFTGGPHERASVEATHRIFVLAGFEPEEALLHVRAFGEMVLSHVLMTASSLAQGEEVHEADMTVAERLYGPSVRTTAYEYEAATFALMLRVHIAGLESILADAGRGHDDTT